MTANRDDFDAWLPVEYGDEAIEHLTLTSAVEQFARSEPMAENTKNIPRFRDFEVSNVAKGDAYAYTDSVKDRIELVAKKVGGISKIADEDLTGDLQVRDPLQPLRNAAGTALALNYDNSCLGVSAAQNASTIKYTSVYRAVRQAVSDPDDFDDGYGADDNYVAITRANFKAAGAGKGYDTLSDLLAIYETSWFFSESETVVAADPAFKGMFRGMKNADGDPYITQVGVDVLGRPKYQVFGYPVVWTKGARVSAVDTSKPTGNPLLILGNRSALIRGNRALSPQIPADSFGWAIQRSAFGEGFDSDESKVKAAYRRAFAVGTRRALAVLELLP